MNESFCLSLVINIIGLSIDIFGALLIYVNSPRVNYQVYVYQQEELIELERKANRKHRRTQLGAMLLVFGFIFQIAGNLIK